MYCNVIVFFLHTVCYNYTYVLNVQVAGGMTSHVVTYAYCQAFNDLLDNIKVIQYLFEKAVRGDRQKDMTKGKNKFLENILIIFRF